MQKITTSNDKLTLGEQRLLRELIKGKKPKEAAYAATNVTNDNSARVVASQMMKRDRFQRALKKAGLTDAILAKTFVNGIKANKGIVVDKKIYDYPDHAVRHQYLKTALVVKGYYRRTDDAEESHHDPLIVKSIQMFNQTVNVGAASKTDDNEVIEGNIGGEKKDFEK